MRDFAGLQEDRPAGLVFSFFPEQPNVGIRMFFSLLCCLQGVHSLCKWQVLYWHGLLLLKKNIIIIFPPFRITPAIGHFVSSFHQTSQGIL